MGLLRSQSPNTLRMKKTLRLVLAVALLGLLSSRLAAQDVTPPTIKNIPANISVSNDPQQCGASVSWVPPTASDDVGVVEFTSTHQPGDIFPTGETLVTYTARDAANNVTLARFSITVSDTELPTIAFQKEIRVPAGETTCSAIVRFGVGPGEYPLPVPSDNCGIASLTNNIKSDNYPLGESLITWTATDINGNTFAVKQRIFVFDNTPPAFLCPGEITINSCNGIATWSLPTVSEACGIVTISQVSGPVSGKPLADGRYLVTYRAEDESGNESTCSFTINKTTALTLSGAVTSGSCANGNRGSIEISVTGGVAPYTYLWNTGATTATLADLSAGTYSVTVSDANGCSGSFTTTVTNEPCCNVTSGGSIAGDERNCGPFDPARITSVALPEGGLGALEYVWLATTNENVVITNVGTAGVDYQVLPDSNSPEFDPASLSVTTWFRRCARRAGCIVFLGETNWVKKEVLPVAQLTVVVQNGTCANGNLGTATATVTGGTAPFTFSWSNGAQTAEVAGLAAGSYSVTVTDANQCSISATATVSTEICQVVKDLNLTSECSFNESERRWRVTNPNDFTVEVNWVVYNTTQTGTLQATPGLTYFTTQAMAGPNTTIIRWTNEKGETRQVTKASGNQLCCHTSGVTQTVAAFTQGKRKDGKAVGSHRSDPNQALGYADAKDSPAGGIKFVSLGFGGSIVLEFDRPLCNQPGPDIRVVETSYGNPRFAHYPEQAEVFVSQDGRDWKSLGLTQSATPATTCQQRLDTEFDFEGKFAWIKFVRVVDVTKPNASRRRLPDCKELPARAFNNAADGFDVDAVETIQKGEDLKSNVAGRGQLPDDSGLSVVEFNPSAVIFPNPVKDELTIDLAQEEELVLGDEANLTLEILDMRGAQHRKQFHNLDDGMVLRSDVTSLAPGVYVARTQLNGTIRVYKFVKE